MSAKAILEEINHESLAQPPIELPDIEQLNISHDEMQPNLDFDSAISKLDSEGGIDAHKNRYGGDISKCPFLGSMGATGIKLMEKIQAAENDPNRGKTMAQILAEKLQSAAKQTIEPTNNKSVKTAVEAEKSTLEPSSHINVPANHSARLAQFEQERQSTLNSLVAFREKPITEAKVAETARPKTEKPAVKKDTFTETPVSKSKVSGQKQAPPKAIPNRVHDVTKPRKPVQIKSVNTRVTSQSVTKQSIELRMLNVTESSIPAAHVDKVRDDQVSSYIHEAIEPTETLLDTAVKLNAEPATEKLRDTDTSEIAPIITEQTFLELPSELSGNTAFAEDEADVTASNHEAGLSQASPPIDAETRAIVLNTLDTITEVVRSLEAQDTPNIEVAIQNIEELCVQLFEILGLTTNEETIKIMSQDILAISHQSTPLEHSILSRDDLNTQGTHEYKTSLASIAQTYLVRGMQRRSKQLATLSKYIVSKLNAPPFSSAYAS